jgi:hypothetical protein
MVSHSINLLLGDFGATKDEASLQGNSEQTGLYSKFFADADARAGNFGPKSDVYAFALCAYFILHGEPLFNEQNENAYEKRERAPDMEHAEDDHQQLPQG